ncbi:MAG: HK97-gp10 family putative phage morphogenesis protein [Dehalococcoidales bacterium]|jgi:HK97 gp10 family phage protein
MATFKSLKWYGDDVYKKIHNEQKKRVRQAAIFLESYIKKSFGTSPSSPGEPPGVDTGRLRNSITHEIEEALWDIIGRVGTNVEYGKWLELGTKDMSPRPYLRRAIEENKQELVNILVGKEIK